MGYEIVPVGDKRTYLYEGWGGYALFKLPQNESIYFMLVVIMLKSVVMPMD